MTSLRTSSWEANKAGAYPGFSYMKRLGEFLLPLDGMLVHRKVTPSIKFAGTWVERSTVRESLLPKNIIQFPGQLGLDPEPLNLGTSALTMRPLSPCLCLLRSHN